MALPRDDIPGFDDVPCLVGREVEVLPNVQLAEGIKPGMQGTIRGDEGGTIKVHFPHEPDESGVWRCFTLLSNMKKIEIQGLKLLPMHKCGNCDHRAAEGDYLCEGCRNGIPQG